MRDEKLDIYRGLIMMYIIGFIHTLYWFPNFGTKIKSFFLFEMAVVFFITGASYSLSNKKSYGKYIISRIPRILIPYFIFIILFNIFMHGIVGFNLINANIMTIHFGFAIIILLAHFCKNIKSENIKSVNLFLIIVLNTVILSNGQGFIKIFNLGVQMLPRL
ncbi:acyltransferase family protein [Romboutsia sp. MSSM.1001216sp_RTP31141st1_G3_RTP31141_220114]|uniref:acyltransferase family protein n=1 Tax=unclassified Romboutsia TaxID=2626894 RepID=UPI0031B5B6CB